MIVLRHLVRADLTAVDSLKHDNSLSTSIDSAFGARASLVILRTAFDTADSKNVRPLSTAIHAMTSLGRDRSGLAMVDSAFGLVADRALLADTFSLGVSTYFLVLIPALERYEGTSRIKLSGIEHAACRLRVSHLSFGPALNETRSLRLSIIAELVTFLEGQGNNWNSRSTDEFVKLWPDEYERVELARQVSNQRRSRSS